MRTFRILLACSALAASLSAQQTTPPKTQLKIGDVLQWDVETAGRVLLRLASLPKFEGRLGTRGKKWAVELTRNT